MSSISKCPRCEQSVTIPEGVGAEALVRCPLCAAEYPLSDALAGVPPALIVVETAPLAAVAAETGDAVALGAMEGIPSFHSLSEAAAAGEAAEVEAGLAPPEASAETAAEAKAAAAPPADESAEGAAVGGATVEAAAPGEGEHELEIATEGEAAAAEGAEEAAEAPPETFDVAAFAGIGQEPSGDGKEPPPGVPRWRTRRKGKEKNPVKEVVGIVLGGFLGLLIGYYVLAWVGLSRRLPQLPLPFLPSRQATPEGENKTDADSDKTQSRAPVELRPFDRFAV